MPHPTPDSAYGIWTLKEIRDAVRGQNWPGSVPPPISDAFDLTVYVDAVNGSGGYSGLFEAQPAQTLDDVYNTLNTQATGTEQILIYMADGTYTTNYNTNDNDSGSVQKYDLKNFQQFGECHFMSQNPGGAKLRWVHDSGRDSLVAMDHKQQQPIHFIGLIIEGDTQGSQPGQQYDMTLVNDYAYTDASGNPAIGNNICTFNNCQFQTENTASTRYYSYGYFNAYNYGRYPFRLLFNNCFINMPQFTNWSNGTGSQCGHIGTGIVGTTAVKAWGVVPSGYNNMSTCTTSATSAVLNAGNFDWSSYPTSSDTFVFP